VSDLLAQLGRLGSHLQPPAWVVDEVQHRVVLLLNHVLMQEPEATARLARQKGRVVLLQWRGIRLSLVATPAGLLDLATPDDHPDLTLTVTEESPLQLVQAAMRGDKPNVRIAGDVQLAAEVNWLVDNVRWDLEEDLSRIVGDPVAHTIGQVARSVAQTLRRFVGPRGSGDTPGQPASQDTSQADKAAP
jgi:ubiquinone biosynthesis protein UbiJ